MTLFPALQDASRDEALRGSAHTVYLWLACNLLNFGEWHAIKVSGVAAGSRVNRDTASAAIRQLVERGYLKRRYVAGAGYEYLLLLHRERASA